MDAKTILLSMLRLADRQRLLLENVALRQQVAVLRRGVKCPKPAIGDRITWRGLAR